ncbi:hypothetical protein MRX96_008476 [Rhipicephalus microplus]
MVDALLRPCIALPGLQGSPRHPVIPRAFSTRRLRGFQFHRGPPRPRSPSGHNLKPFDQGPLSPTHRAVLSAHGLSSSSLAAPVSSGTVLRPQILSSLSSDATSHAPDPSEDPGKDDIDDDTVALPADVFVMELPKDRPMLLGKLTGLLVELYSKRLLTPRDSVRACLGPGRRPCF